MYIDIQIDIYTDRLIDMATKTPPKAKKMEREIGGGREIAVATSVVA